MRPKAEVDNILRDLQNSSYHTKAEFDNCFIIHLKYFKVLNKFTHGFATVSRAQVFPCRYSLKCG